MLLIDFEFLFFWRAQDGRLLQSRFLINEALTKKFIWSALSSPTSQPLKIQRAKRKEKIRWKIIKKKFRKSVLSNNLMK